MSESRFVQGDRCHFNMSIALANKLQQAQLQVLFDKRLAHVARKTLREAKQKHSKSHYFKVWENAKDFLLLGTPTGDRDHLAALEPSRDKAGTLEESIVSSV